MRYNFLLNTVTTNCRKPILIGILIVTLMDYTCTPRFIYKLISFFIYSLENMHQLTQGLVTNHIVSVHKKDIKRWQLNIRDVDHLQTWHILNGCLRDETDTFVGSNQVQNQFIIIGLKHCFRDDIIVFGQPF